MLKRQGKAGVHPSAAWWNMLVEQLPPWDPEGGGLDLGVHFPDPSTEYLSKYKIFLLVCP